MQKEQVQRKPRYFFIVFGPEYAGKHPVDGGCYLHKKGHISSKGIAVGDVTLLYCGWGYPGHFQEAPGIGIVIGTEIGEEGEKVFYQYFPLYHPVGWDILKDLPEVKEHQPLTWVGNWLFELEKTSFRKALNGREIDWS